MKITGNMANQRGELYQAAKIKARRYGDSSPYMASERLLAVNLGLPNPFKLPF